MTSIRSFSKWAGWGDPIEDYSPPPVPPAVPHPLPEGMAGVRRMIEVARKPRHKALIALCGMAGLRVHEALLVRASFVDTREMMLQVFGKNEKVRYVPISPELWSHIQEPVVESFISNDSPCIQIQDRVARSVITTCGERAGLSRRVASHDLRATFATELYNSTLDIRLVQDALGHSSVETTQIYIGLVRDKMRAAVASI